MAELPDARRSQWRATYTPVKTTTPSNGPDGVAITRALSKRAFIAALRPTVPELGAVAKLVPTSTGTAQAIAAFEAVAAEVSPAGIRRSAAATATASVGALTEVAKALVSVRAAKLASLKASPQRIWDAYKRQVSPTAVTPGLPSTTEGWQLAGGTRETASSIYRRVSTANPAARITAGNVNNTGRVTT